LAPREGVEPAGNAPQGASEGRWQERGVVKRRGKKGVVLNKADWSRGSKHAAVGKNQDQNRKEVHGHALKCTILEFKRF
jgi:hypothetical protein